MLLSKLAETEESKDPQELKRELDELEIQMFRIQQNMKDIAKKRQVLGIDQAKDDNWVIVSAVDDGNICKVMLNECSRSFRGSWDFSIHAEYRDKNTIHIGDIRGPEGKGYGTVLMDHLKEIARDQNIQYITGDIAARDWDHVDRLEHFYTKHNFEIDLDFENKSGKIEWTDMN
ncbi:GNAT family N-acetyltransferase [Bacillus marinisedimentorum]|uniref:GNAT family N-acetyltransferase n=1 Tax=Bacillus marinisedimentorum TaxID=1821260 RepID=UPI00087325B6|nr:GNAT family N-acetyltransferase [Bacillus marinisedimentorum]